MCVYIYVHVYVTGELPRNVMLCTDRYLSRSVAPGKRVDVIGVLDNVKTGGGASSKKVCTH